MGIDQRVTVWLGPHGNDHDHLLDGWSDVQDDGFRWTVGKESHMELPPPGKPGDWLLLLSFAPFLFDAALPTQRLSVSVNGRLLEEFEVDGHMVVCCRIPKDCLRLNAPIGIRFGHPDATSPKALGYSPDERELGFAFYEVSLATASTRKQAATPPRKAAPPPDLPLEPQDLLMQFASLGDNCEFGLIQRRHHADPMGLFRFAATPYPALIAALQDDFEKLLDPTRLMFRLRGPRPREYILHHRDYSFQIHTLTMEATLPIARIFDREFKKLVFLRRLMLADLAAGNRIFVHKHNVALDWFYIEHLGRLLHRHGPNVLLTVIPAPPGVVPGHVEVAAPFLLRGHIDSFRPYECASEAGSPVWLTLCRNAYQLWRSGAAEIGPPLHPALEAAD